MSEGVILLVEDEPDIHEGLRKFLEREGYSVHSAFHGRSALDFLMAGNQVRIILLDLMMPVMDGYEFLLEVRSGTFEALEKIPVVLISAVRELDRIARSLGTAYVAKPIDLNRLLEIIATHQ